MANQLVTSRYRNCDRLLRVVLVAAVTATLFMMPTGAQGQALGKQIAVLKSTLLGSNPVNNDGVKVGDPKATGQLTFTVYNTTTGEYNVRYVITALNLTGGKPPVESHIHEAPPGKNGQHAFDLTAGSWVKRKGGFQRTGVVRRLSKQKDEMGMNMKVQVKRIMATPANFYCQLHTNQYAKGAVRGQLYPGTGSAGVKMNSYGKKA